MPLAPSPPVGAAAVVAHPWDGRAIVEGGPATREDARLPPRAGPRRPDGHPKPTGAALATASDRVPLDGIHFSHPRKALPRRADALWVTRNGTKNWAKRHTGLRNSRMSSSPRPQLYEPSLGGLSGVEMATGPRQWRTRVGVQPGLHGLRRECGWLDPRRFAARTALPLAYPRMAGCAGRRVPTVDQLHLLSPVSVVYCRHET